MAQARPSVEEWAVSRLTAGLPRRQVVDELLQQGAWERTDAEALVKRVEAALVPTGHKSKLMVVGAIGLITLVLMLALLLLRAAPGA